MRIIRLTVIRQLKQKIVPPFYILIFIYTIFVAMSDQEYNRDTELLLWKTVVNDDEKAFEKLFSLFYSALAVYARRYIEEQAIREDIVQDVFVTLWENRKRLTITTSIRSYLTLAVRNHCLNYLKKEGINRQYQELDSAEESMNEHDVYLLSELYDLLEKALNKLPETYRLVFEMHRFDGKNYDEIARELQISVRTAKRYKSQVIELLKDELKDYLPLYSLLFSILN